MNILNNIKNTYVLITQNDYIASIRVLKLKNLTKLSYSIFQNNQCNIIKKTLIIEQSAYNNNNESININFNCNLNDSYFIFIELEYTNEIVNCYDNYSYTNKNKENIEFNITKKNKKKENEISEIQNLPKALTDDVNVDITNIYCDSSEISSDEEEEEDEDEDEEEDENEEEDNDEEEDNNNDNDEEEEEDNDGEDEGVDDLENEEELQINWS